MTMRNDIKSAIEEILTANVLNVESAVESACDVVDSIMSGIEEILDSAVSDLDDPDNIESVIDDLQKAFREI